MKPEELFDPAAFPEDLQWIVARYRLQPDDPVFLLIAWHWHRIKACEDTLRAGTLELRTLLDSRIQSLGETAETVTGVSDALSNLQAALEEKPAEFSKQLEASLKTPLGEALGQVAALTRDLTPLARRFQVAQRRQLLAALLVGVALGVLGAVILFLR
ncbi:MAG: hypothetical protein JWM32_1595 [Verrucomicrobia bacterium]|nr:hypothetical protein [Verrucomicrobiota bacterium]